MDKIEIIAVFEEYCGIGISPEDALHNLKNLCRDTIEFEEVQFYSAKEIKVEQRLIIIEDEMDK